jgi:hypothetical protein
LHDPDRLPVGDSYRSRARKRISRDALLKPLQAVSGIVERRQTLPILANVLLEQKDGRLFVTATDLEMQITANSELAGKQILKITPVPGRDGRMNEVRAFPPGPGSAFPNSTPEARRELSWENVNARPSQASLNHLQCRAYGAPFGTAGEDSQGANETLGSTVEHPGVLGP